LSKIFFQALATKLQEPEGRSLTFATHDGKFLGRFACNVLDIFGYDLNLWYLSIYLAHVMGVGDAQNIDLPRRTPPTFQPFQVSPEQLCHWKTKAWVLVHSRKNKGSVVMTWDYFQNIVKKF